MVISYVYCHLVVKNGNFICLLTFCGQEWQLHMSTDIWWSSMIILYGYWHVVVKDGNFISLVTYHGQKWQCHISTDIYWPRMAIAHVYRHLVLMNDNFILLQICSSKEWPFHIVCHISWSRMALLSWHTYENIHLFRKPRHVMPQMDCLEKNKPCCEDFNTHLWGFWGDRLENVHF